MREQELDKFLDKYVEITECDGDKQKGYFYKIVNSRTKVYGREESHAINKGYYLERLYPFQGGIDYRKSHIKSIRLLEVNNG